DHFHDLLGALHDRNTADFRRTDRVRRERDDVIRPLNDVDLLTAKLSNDRLHTRALHAHAGADGVDILFARRDGDLRTFTGFTRDALDLHSPVVDLGNFRLEQVLNQCWVGARNDDLRPLRCLFNLDDDHADTIANRKVLELRLLAPRQFSFSLAELDNNVAVFETLHDAVHDFADVLVVLGVHALALRFADLLKN